MIFMENIVVSVRIGCNENERLEPQPIQVDVRMEFDIRAAGKSDSLKDTLDYVKAYRLLKEVARSQEFFLLERFSELCAEALLRLGARSVWIRVSKERCPIPGMQGRIGVEIERRKDNPD